MLRNVCYTREKGKGHQGTPEVHQTNMIFLLLTLLQMPSLLPPFSLSPRPLLPAGLHHIQTNIFFLTFVSPHAAVRARLTWQLQMKTLPKGPHRQLRLEKVSSCAQSVILLSFLSPLRVVGRIKGKNSDENALKQ